MFGSTSTPVSVGQSAPSLSMLVLWVAYPKRISRSRSDTRLANRKNHRGPQFWLAGRAFPASSMTNTEIVAQELPAATRPSPTGVRRGVNFERGGRDSRNFQRRVRAGRPETCSPRALAGRGSPGGETFSEFPAMPPRRAISDFILQ
jgi:hypothetical protein